MKHGTGMALTDKDFETYKSKMNIINNLLDDIGWVPYRFVPEAKDYIFGYPTEPLSYKSKKIIYNGNYEDISNIALKIRQIIDILVDCIRLVDPNFRKTNRNDNKENTKDNPYFDFGYTTQADFLKNLDKKYPCYYTFFPIRITNPNNDIPLHFKYKRQGLLHKKQKCQTELNPHVIALIHDFTSEIIHKCYDKKAIKIANEELKKHIEKKLKDIHPTHYIYMIFKSYLENKKPDNDNDTFSDIVDNDILANLIMYLGTLCSQNVCNRINTQKSSKNKICIEESIFSQQQKNGVAFVKCSEEHYLDIKQ